MGEEGPERCCLSAVTGREESDPGYRAPLHSPQSHPGSSETDAALAPLQINEGRDAGVGSTHQHILFFKNLFIHFFGYAGSLLMCRLFFQLRRAGTTL